MNSLPYCCLAVDLGASSGRVMAGIFDAGKLTIREIHRFENGPTAHGETLYWEFDRLWSEIRTGIRNGIAELRSEGLRASTIGVDSWGVDFGLLNAEGDLITPPVHYRDERTNGMMERVFAEDVSRDEIFERTGIQFMQLNTLFQLAALKRRDPRQLAGATSLMLIGDLFHYLLTGTVACEYTNATTTQLCDARTRTWSDHLIRQLEFPRAIFPKIIPPGTRVGRLRPELADELGAPEIELVAVATHDTGSAVAAVPASGDQFAYISCGTWSLLGSEVREPVITPESARLNFTNEGGVDGTYRLLKNIMGLWLLQESRAQWMKEGKSYSWPEITAMAEGARPFGRFVDPDDGRFLTPGDMPTRIAEACVASGQPPPQSDSETVRCILESLALKCAWAMDRLEGLVGTPLETIHMVGGGIQNRLLCQWTANATGRRVVAGPIEATAIGNIGMQLVAAGKVAGLAGLREMVRHSFAPDVYEPESVESWRSARDRFNALFP